MRRMFSKVRYMLGNPIVAVKAITMAMLTLMVAGWAYGADKAEVFAQLGHSGYVNSVAISPDGKYALSGSMDNTLKLWEIATGKKIRTFTGHSDRVNSVAISPDGKYALSGSWDKTLKLWDISTGKEIRTFTGHSNRVDSVAISPDGKYALSGSWDSTIRLWDIATGKELLQCVSFDDGEWLAITPEGYYNASVNGDKYLNVRVGNNVYGIDQYRATFYKPQVVEAAIRLGNTREAIAQVLGSKKEAQTIANIQNIEPPFVVIKSPDDGTEFNLDSQNVSIHVEDRNQTIKQVKILINGRQVTGNDTKRLVPVGSSETNVSSSGIKIPEGQKTIDQKVPVKLEQGKNLIEVFAFNGYSEGRKKVSVTFKEKVGASTHIETILPNLWILSIGVNRYDSNQIRTLNYAAKDAEAIVGAFKKQQGKLFREVNSLIISDLSSIKPTYDNIVDNLKYLTNAGQYDVILLFIAGHGVNDETGNYYFLPSDAAINDDGTIKRSKAISWREIKSMLDLPSKKLIFADTCHSEGIGGKKTRAADIDRFVKDLQDANTVIFTSSRGRELSQESHSLKHGIFTYTIIKGMEGEAILIDDKTVTMKELDAYVSKKVPQHTNGAQHPITYTPEGYANFPVAVIK
ncbi:MAG: caspase family protein [Nitrospirae bacterium]|nr:caspase family protein [Nitrospirota bacterium]